jgi:two-component system, OmpR family, phosphate regulon sensor histidine kinase PhoR
VSLTKRLVLGAVVLVSALALAIVVIAGNRLRARLVEEALQELTREARLVGIMWTRDAGADAVADSSGAAIGRRVTLVDDAGVVRGDSEFDGAALASLENHAARPEIVMARAAGLGHNERQSHSAGDEEFYVAVRHPLGFVRVSISTASLRRIVAGAQRDVLVASFFALLGALVIAYLFSRSVSKPVIELRDVARDIAAGNLERRPSLSAPGEVGDLAIALHRMTEQLGSRLEALESDEALLIAVVEALAQGLVVIDASRRVVRLNSSARRLLDLQDAVPFSVDRLPHEGHLPRAVRSAMSGTPVETAELTIAGRTMTLTARPLPDGGAVLAFMDLTARRRLETMRRDFVANVSHELKTPLTVINGFAETLLDPNVPELQRQEFAATIQSNAKRMQRIVDDLLDLSRYESGAWRPNPAMVDLRAATAEIMSTVRARAEAKGLAMHAEIGTDAERVYADPTALRQILDNLVQNAVRYTPRGSVTLFSMRSEGGILVGVRDTGVGIAAEHLPRIFERFYRVDPGRARDEGGTGLGLAIVRHLAESHGGTVRAESTPGVGTTIAVDFPPPPANTVS